MNKFKKYPNNQSGSILTLLILILVLGAGVFLYLGIGNSSNLTNQIKEIVFKQGSKEDAKDNTTSAPTSQAQIMITSIGFTPSTITVSKGQQVIWVNKDKSEHKIVFQGLELDSEVLKQDESFVFVFENQGTFTYQDEKKLLKTPGIIIVK